LLRLYAALKRNGRLAVIVLDAEVYDRIAQPKPDISLVDFLESLEMGGLDLTRDDDPSKFKI
jgi:hypothetical protein